MLKVNKNITITGQSIIDNQQVAFMNATISTDGRSNVNITKNVVNQELYNTNKDTIRKDMSDFEVEVYKVQDDITSTSNEVIETEPTETDPVKGE